VPHQPYCEQQFPYEEPWQVKPLVPAQVPSVETFFVAVDAGAEDVPTGVDETPTVEEAAPEPEQVPKAELQPVEQ